jgi:asparagine synthase (glutamine-hydrolysing)
VVAPISAEATYLPALARKARRRLLRRAQRLVQRLDIDVAQRRVTLFNDRYGLARVYVHEAADRTWFASEAKALLAVLPHLRKLDPSSPRRIPDLRLCAREPHFVSVASGSCPGDALGIHRRPRAPPRRYFDAKVVGRSSEARPGRVLRAAQGHLRAHPAEVRFRRRPVGVSLTGGVDSRMVMAWARAPRGSLRTYTFGGMYRDCTDVSIARRVAKLSGQEHACSRWVASSSGSSASSPSRPCS